MSYLTPEDREREYFSKLRTDVIARRLKAHGEATDALLEECESNMQTVWKWLETQTVVRNIQNDHRHDWGLRMLKFTGELKQFEELLAKLRALGIGSKEER